MPTVTVTGDQLITVPVAVLALTGFAPTVTATANVTVTPGVASLTLTGFAPTITVAGQITGIVEWILPTRAFSWTPKDRDFDLTLPARVFTWTLDDDDR